MACFCGPDVGRLSGPSRLQRLLQSELRTTVFQLSVHGAASAEPSADVAARWEGAILCAHYLQWPGFVDLIKTVLVSQNPTSTIAASRVRGTRRERACPRSTCRCRFSCSDQTLMWQWNSAVSSLAQVSHELSSSSVRPQRRAGGRSSSPSGKRAPRQLAHRASAGKTRQRRDGRQQ